MIVVTMGVTGSGKSTVGELLANSLRWPFYDADDYHPPENVEKMSNGIALTDEDREPWLRALRQLVADALRENRSLVLACSALKQSYREVIRPPEADHSDCRVHFVYLKGSYELIRQRLEERKGHYMNPALLESQFATLEEPSPEEALHVDIAAAPAEIVEHIRSRLGV